MAEASSPEWVKVIVAILWSDPESLDVARVKLMNHWGAIDIEGHDRPFDTTGFYTDEMGPALQRRLVSHEALINPDFLPAAKHACNRIEDESRLSGGRRVNLDIGYLDHNKIVLASMKAAGQKIYLSDGVYADLTARFGGGRYQPFEWTFPDLRDGRYDDELARIRDKYRQQRKARVSG